MKDLLRDALQQIMEGALEEKLGYEKSERVSENGEENHRYITKAAYVVLGIRMDGKKDILDVWIGENESSKLGLSARNDLKNRGVQGVYVFCVEGLNDFREAIGAVYPKAQLQRCITPQIRSSTRYVSYKDIKAPRADLKPVYQAINIGAAFTSVDAHTTQIPREDG